MDRIRQPSFARPAPVAGAVAALVWLSCTASSGASPAAPGPWLLLAAPPAAPEPAAAPADAAPPRPDPLAGRPFAAEIRAVAGRYALDPLLVAAVVEVESNYAPHAVSEKGAVGLMQLMPLHFDGAHPPLDPRDNLERGARYLAALERRFGDLAAALAAYHAGPGAVERAGGRAPYRSTRAYVERVLSTYVRFQEGAGRGGSRAADAAQPRS
jgi:soluble lytic murein transglycosylase-like protein